MLPLRRNLWSWIFGVVSLLLLLQVVWWAYVFLRYVDRQQALELRIAELESPATLEVSRKAIEEETVHQRIMFLSEALFFASASIFGTFLLYRFLRREHHFTEIQRNFIEVMSHESKTPLTALKLRMESVRENRSQDEWLVRELTLALQEVRRLHSLFERSMALHRMERHELSLEILPVSEMIREILHRMEPLLRDRQIETTVKLDEEATVLGDSYSLQNTFQNVIENAVLYNTSPRKKLGVSLERRGAQVLVKIADNGPGVTETDRTQIFERFYRGESGRGVPGTGLGLYIAKRVVEAHQGWIRLASNSEGASFELGLPFYG